ncbi:MAG: ABC transporter transmembrane domain-containing protein, partial [Traorella sp.]
MKSKISIIHIIYEVIKKNILKTIFLVICIILAILLSVTPPLVLEKAINLLTQKQMISLTLACFYFVLLALGGIFDSLKESMITIMGQKITHQVRLEMVNKLNHLSSNEYYLNDSGEMTSIFVGDVDSLEKLFTSGVISMIIDCLKIISLLVII